MPLVDLYELTMAQSYHRRGLTGEATFAYFVRSPVPNRRFLVFAGVDPLLAALEGFRFGEEDLAYLGSLGLFDREFLDCLRGFRFSGEVWAAEEGEVVFPGEPLLLVTAPRIEGQLVETLLLNLVNYATLVASKAARIVLAAGEDAVLVDFSPRRDHGGEAALQAARSSFLAGFHATSNVEAGRRYGIPLAGTMAHSYVMSFPDEISAFRAFARDHPRPILLLDTYDTLQGARHAVEVARELRAAGQELFGVRLDSGDLAALSREVRRVLDAEGFPAVRIFVSGDLDEERILEFRARGGAAWGYGVGTRLGVSWDLPALGGVYKLVEDEKGPRMKTSPGKVSLPGRCQVWRREGYRDLVTPLGERGEGRPLLRRVMAGGRRLVPPLDLPRRREEVRRALFSLPPELADLAPEGAPSYPVAYAPALASLVEGGR
ncbi:MAG: nicotinate phosphoribosyltransferase [Candidatus Bipolaricaulota bacterium]|nr:nicotinate phosphoribosyltransferase [Candidatus Bipolaricaulota bacterium]